MRQEQLALAVIVLAVGCTTSSAGHLSDLLDPEIAADDHGLVLFYQGDDCYTLPTVHASLDGTPLLVEVLDTSEGCDFWRFAFPDAPTQPVTMFELADDVTTWQFGVEGLTKSYWTVDNTSLTEGSEFTVSIAPAVSGVTIDVVYLSGLIVPGPPLARTNTSVTLRIPAGFWSDDYPTWHGTTFDGSLSVNLSGLPTPGCPLVKCDFRVITADKPVSIVIP